MAENKIARIPIASHGLHKHSYNYPWLSSINFGDVMPCYINPIRKGEKDSPSAGMYSQLMPIAHNAFATGRFNFKAIFVPYKLVWKLWYSFDQQCTYHGSAGAAFIPSRYPYVTHGSLTNYIVENFGVATTDDDYDFVTSTTTGTIVQTPYKLNAAGRRVFRILGALGCMPNFLVGDKTTINILPILCYLKAFLDYYFPNNYVSNGVYNDIMLLLESEDVSFENHTEDLLAALEACSLNFYQNSIFDFAWDRPTAPNTGVSIPNVSIPDITNNASTSGGQSAAAVVTNDPNSANSPNNAQYKPSNGTPFVGGQYGTSSIGNSYNTSVFTKYVLDALTSVSMWAKRHQLSGARLIDRFLVSRGVTLSNDSARISYFVGQRNVEISVSGVANTTDTALGELAGRGVASSGNEPLHFECKPDDDGIFLVLVSPLPDANFPINLDGYANRVDFMDNYHAEFDKLGVSAVPSRVIQQSLNGGFNMHAVNHVYGFLNQYWDEVQERPRLLGDFILKSRGADELSAYHTFRLFSNEPFHSYNFIRMIDQEQYQRLFYSSEQENLMLFLRWYGDQYKEKLPLGDSYEWDDDELNRKVSVVVGGSQK